MLLHEAEQLAKQLLAEYELDEWTFRFDHAKRRFGQCDYRRKVISLSKHLTALNGRDEVEETIRHEIAHALAGPHAKHGPDWKRECIRVGAKPERCYDAIAIEAPQHNYEGHCPNCGLLVSKRIRLKEATKRNIVCGPCYRKGTALRLVWTRVNRTSNHTLEFVEELP